MTETKQELMVKYAEDMTERERAGLETRIWSLVPKNERIDLYGKSAGGQSKYIAKLFNISSMKTRYRQFLYGLGLTADVLWYEIEHRSMPLITAVRIYQSAKEQFPKDRASISQEDASQILLQEIERYKSTGIQCVAADGKIYRRKTGSRLPKANEARPSPENVTKFTGMPFWNTLRGLIASHLDELFPNSDPLILEKTRKEFEIELNLLISGFQDRVNRIQRQSVSSIKRPGRSRIIEWCNILGIIPPKKNKPVDKKLANTQLKRGARAYHPDMHGGDETTRPQYEAYVEAYKGLMEYNEALESQESRDSHVGQPGNPDEHQQEN